MSEIDFNVSSINGEMTIKCVKCGNIIMSGTGARIMFSSGATLGCMKCGNKFTFSKNNNEKTTFEV